MRLQEGQFSHSIFTSNASNLTFVMQWLSDNPVPFVLPDYGQHSPGIKFIADIGNALIIQNGNIRLDTLIRWMNELNAG
jgi:hypothetical protein